MIKNYFKTAWRNIVKHRFYSVVNIVGLLAGIAFTLLIGAYVWGEFRVNRNLDHAGRQYFLQSEWKGEDIHYAVTTLAPIAKRLKEDYPGLVANYYRWDGITSGVSKGDRAFREGIQLGDSTLLSMYGFKLLSGDPATALKEPYSAVITEATAVKYFGQKEALGQTISIQSFSGGKSDLTITGVLKSIPKNSVTNVNDNNSNTIFIPSNTYSFFGRTSLEEVYATEIQLKKAAFTATVLSLVIVMLGVLGLISLSIHKRVKEISVRKVLGASVPNITMLFVKDFMLVVLIAALIACPVAYFIMQGWLNNYASRISITATPFLWPVAALSSVTLVLIALQTLKAATTNPMKNLRSE